MKTILIVDDQPDIRNLVELILRRPDRAFIKAENGAEAVRLTGEEIPDLVLMDVMMPGEWDGLEAIRRIKGNSRTCRCPVIAMTADVRREEIERALSVGAADVVLKPFGVADLTEKVDRLLGGGVEPGR